MGRRGSESVVFFPWERRGGVLGALGRARVRLVVLTALGIALVVWIRGREESAAAVRATRATLTTTHRALAAFRADHAGTCPKELAELVSGGYVRDLPLDAWGRPLRLTCPGRKDPRGYDLISDGPDGLPYGLDRVD